VIEPGSHVAWFMKGVLLGKMEDYESAIGCFDRAIEISPNYVEAWYHKGIYSGILGNNEEAARCMTKTLEIDPDFDPNLHRADDDPEP
jgi:tetratricopeptide (TPR) repeat protein